MSECEWRAYDGNRVVEKQLGELSTSYTHIEIQFFIIILTLFLIFHFYTLHKRAFVNFALIFLHQSVRYTTEYTLTTNFTNKSINSFIYSV